jgi:hypothetical protein
MTKKETRDAKAYDKLEDVFDCRRKTRLVKRKRDSNWKEET